jgi:hypothetical protein
MNIAMFQKDKKINRMTQHPVSWVSLEEKALLQFVFRAVIFAFAATCASLCCCCLAAVVTDMLAAVFSFLEFFADNIFCSALWATGDVSVFNCNFLLTVETVEAVIIDANWLVVARCPGDNPKIDSANGFAGVAGDELSFDALCDDGFLWCHGCFPFVFQCCFLVSIFEL